MPTLTNMKIPNRVPKRKKHAFLQSLFFMVIILVAVYFLLQSSFFNIKTIKVSGNIVLGEKEITDLAGLSTGVNIFKANLQTAAGNLKLNPLVRDVRLSRKLPNQVVISITEREPVGLIPDKSRFISVDKDGIYLNASDNLNKVNYPLITGDKIIEGQPGQKVTTEKIDAGLKYLVNIPEDVRSTVLELNIKNINQMIIYTLQGFQVRLGGPDKVKEKAQLYQALIKQLNKEEKLDYIDIADVDHPVKKPVLSTDTAPQENSTPTDIYQPPLPVNGGRGSIPD